MERVSHVIGTYHEVALKGGNRGFFERVLRKNVARALDGLPVAEVSMPSRVVVRFREEQAWSAVYPRLFTVFGLNGVIPVARAGDTYDDLERFIGGRLELFSGESFGVRVRRSDKRFPFTSQDVARRLGGFVKQATGMRVDLDHPEVPIHVLLQTDGIYVFRTRSAGPGGLPVGSSGRVLVLLSGGIDSPAAAYLTLKRGTRAHFVHFHSAPYTSDASVRKAEEIARILGRHQGTARMAVVPFAEFQREVVTSCPEKLRVVLYRRMMLRVAERIARRWRCAALVTGDSLNQVASQTLENIAAIDRVAHMPVLRPLIGMDKIEAIAVAERAGTFELSIMPHQDCCSFLQPAHPATRTTPIACDVAEQPLDLEEWARRLQDEAELRPIAPAPWDSLVPPPARSLPAEVEG